MKNIFLFDCYSDPAEELNGDHRPAGGLRGWKYLPCLDGTRVPFIVRWPGSRPSGATTDPFMPRDIRLPLGPRFLLPGVLPDASNLVPDPATSATHLRGRKTILICGAVFAALLSGAWAQAAELPVPAIGVKDQLVFSDDFGRTGLGAALKSPIPAFTVADGLLKGRQERADHGGTLAAVLPLPDGNTIIEIKFRFAGARSFNLACDDISYRGTHAGHISRVTIRPNRITLYDDKEGVMRNDIYALRRSDDPLKKAEGDRLAEKATAHFPVKLEQDRWYSFGLEIVGDRMQVSIDGRLVGHLQSPGLVHATKPNLRLSTWGSAPAQEVHFDELRVWSVKTTAESNEPRCPPGPFSESTEEVEGEESAFGLDFLSQFAGVSWDEAETDRGKRNSKGERGHRTESADSPNRREGVV